MGWRETVWARDHARRGQRMTPSAMLVLYALASRAQSGRAWPSVATVMDDTDLSERGVRLALAALVHAGIMTRTERTGRSTVYTLRMDTGCEDTPALSAWVDDDPGALSAGEGGTECRGGGHSVPPERVRERSTERGSLSVGGPRLVDAPEGEGAPPEFVELEAIALECIPRGKRRGNALDGISAQQLVGLYREHGFDAVKTALMTCGGADRPVAMAARALSRGPTTSTGRPRPSKYLES